MLTDVAARFAEKVAPMPDGCHLWVAGLTKNGYGVFHVDGRSLYAHRFAFEAAYGPIPADRELDHRCRQRSCVNPYHLEAVTRRTNTLRGIGPSLLAALNATKQACPHGHPYDTENTRLRPTGGRSCRACARECTRSRRARGEN